MGNTVIASSNVSNKEAIYFIGKIENKLEHRIDHPYEIIVPDPSNQMYCVCKDYGTTGGN